MSEQPRPSDYRKHYPQGTRAAVTIDAETNEPQTMARGMEFQVAMRDAMLEARTALERRLTDKGFTVNVKIVEADCGAWWPDDAVDFARDRQDEDG